MEQPNSNERFRQYQQNYIKLFRSELGANEQDFGRMCNKLLQKARRLTSLEFTLSRRWTFLHICALVSPIPQTASKQFYEFEMTHKVHIYLKAPPNQSVITCDPEDISPNDALSLFLKTFIPVDTQTFRLSNIEFHCLGRGVWERGVPIGECSLLDYTKWRFSVFVVDSESKQDNEDEKSLEIGGFQGHFQDAVDFLKRTISTMMKSFDTRREITTFVWKPRPTTLLPDHFEYLNKYFSIEILESHIKNRFDLEQVTKTSQGRNFWSTKIELKGEYHKVRKATAWLNSLLENGGLIYNGFSVLSDRTIPNSVLVELTKTCRHEISKWKNAIRKNYQQGLDDYGNESKSIGGQINAHTSTGFVDYTNSLTILFHHPVYFQTDCSERNLDVVEVTGAIENRSTYVVRCIASADDEQAMQIAIDQLALLGEQLQCKYFEESDMVIDYVQRMIFEKAIGKFTRELNAKIVLEEKKIWVIGPEQVQQDVIETLRKRSGASIVSKNIPFTSDLDIIRHECSISTSFIKKVKERLEIATSQESGFTLTMNNNPNQYFNATKAFLCTIAAPIAIPDRVEHIVLNEASRIADELRFGLLKNEFIQNLSRANSAASINSYEIGNSASQTNSTEINLIDRPVDNTRQYQEITEQKINIPAFSRIPHYDLFQIISIEAKNISNAYNVEVVEEEIDSVVIRCASQLKLSIETELINSIFQQVEKYRKFRSTAPSAW